MIRFGNFKVRGFVAACIALDKNNVAKNASRGPVAGISSRAFIFGQNGGALTKVSSRENLYPTFLKLEVRNDRTHKRRQAR